MYYNVNSESTTPNQNKNLFSNIESRISAYGKWKAANGKDLDDWLTKKQLKNILT